MGKRTRKKRQNNKNTNSPQHSKNKPSSESNTNDTNSSVLLQRIRHADPRTRHAALAAVANTLLDTSRTTPPKISTTLLQAIRERVMDADLDVCQVAAGCLANYVTLVAALDQVAPTQSLTAGWTLVLIGRLKQCQEQFLAQTNTTPNNNNNNKSSSKKKAAPPTSIAKMQKQWLALAVQCLRTLCLLMETNPEAVGRLTSSMDATPRRDFHQTLLEWMQQSQHYYTSATKEEETLQGFYQQILTLAARTLHSAWDDNADLLVPFQQESPQAFQNGMKLLETIFQQPTTSSLPVVAQLHCMGAYLTARSFVSNTQDVLQNTILPQLSQQLSKFSWTMAQSLLQSYQQVSEKWDQEQADDALEKDVIRKVEERKEPARQIARRQKALKDAAKAEQDAKDEKMLQDDATKKDDSAMDAEDQHQQQVETQQALEQAREAWNQFLLPLQLSLELLANLTSSAGVQEDDDDNDAMMMDEDDWGPDQEAQWMQHQQQHAEAQQSQSAQQNDLNKLLIESPLPQQLHQLSQHIYQIPQGMPFPEQSREDVQDLQSKTMACLGNCWETIPSWPIAVSWAQLQQAATTATGSGQEGLVSAMVIALRTFSKVRKEWQPEHVTFWLNQLNNTSATSPTVRRDIITMLGILCSQEAHPAEVNQKICTALLSALTTNNESESVLIPCEVLNVLMDMYGNDDEDDGCCHVSVFESLEVLRHFQRSIPTLKSKLKQQERTCDNKAEVEQWKETLLNASRFVQYKKGQL